MSLSLLPATSALLVTTDAIGVALGASSSASTVTKTLTTPNMALGTAIALAVAENTDGTLPHTAAATAGTIVGGDALSGLSNTVALDVSAGQTALSVSNSVTLVSALSPIA